MPRIDELDNLKVGFKKKEYRAWDNNLLESLKIPKEKRDDKPNDTVLSPKSEPAKEITNVEKNQSVDLAFNSRSTSVPLAFNSGSNSVQPAFNSHSTSVPLGFNSRSTSVQKEEAISVQPEINDNAYSIDSLIKKLGGNEQKIFFYVVEICIAKGSLSTGEIHGKIIMGAVGTNRNGMETAIRRLKLKGLISREIGKTGKNGLICLSLSETVKNEAIKYMHSSQADQIHRDQGSISVQSKSGISVPLAFKNTLYSSSNNKNTITALPDEWKKINFLPLESIGFSEQHLLDIYSTNLCDSTIVQESIYHFAFGLEEGRHKQYDSPLKVFIGRLRKGNAWIESNYESPKEKALRELLERKKIEKEKRDAMIKELVGIEFPAWRKNLTQDEIKKIVPPDALKTNIAPAITAALRTHYIDNILLPKLVNDKLVDDDCEYQNEGE